VNLYLRKVAHPQAHDNYRVVLKLDEGEFEIGSIGIQHGAAWRWGIDTVILMRVLETQGSPAINGVVTTANTNHPKALRPRLLATPTRTTKPSQWAAPWASRSLRSWRDDCLAFGVAPVLQ